MYYIRITYLQNVRHTASNTKYGQPNTFTSMKKIYSALHCITLFCIRPSFHYDLSQVGHIMYIALEWYVYTPLLAYCYKAIAVPPSWDCDYDRGCGLTCLQYMKYSRVNEIPVLVLNNAASMAFFSWSSQNFWGYRISLFCSSHRLYINQFQTAITQAGTTGLYVQMCLNTLDPNNPDFW